LSIDVAKKMNTNNENVDSGLDGAPRARSSRNRRFIPVVFNFGGELGVFVESTEHAIEIWFGKRPLQQSFVLEPLDVGEFAQARQSENLQELPRRDIAKGAPACGVRWPASMSSRRFRRQ
jgi:hypothetical protein